MSRIIGTKGELEQRLDERNTRLPDEQQVGVPARIHDDTQLPSPDLEPRFPNLIVKDTRVDQAKGITMFRCESLPAGANEGTRQAFQYVIPDRVELDHEGERREFVVVFRAHILLTPDGGRYLATRKDISPEPVPPSLAMGPVVDVKGYISNLHLGSYTVKASDGEWEAHRRFAESVGDCVHELLKARHGSLTLDGDGHDV